MKTSTPHSQPITKAVIAAAGFGTRFLPQTKAMPKEMLPLIDKPIIQYVVEELVAAGIKDIIIVTGANKRSIEDHFDMPNQDLITNLIAGGEKKQQILHEINAIATLANFVYVRQKGPYGNATPIWCAAHLIGDEPFIYTYADDFFVATPGRTAQLIDVYREFGGSVLACKSVTDDKDYERYGFVGGSKLKDGTMRVSSIVEKPGKDRAPSKMASVSGYLLTPDIFRYIEQALHAHDSGELVIQPIMQRMIDDGIALYAQEIHNGDYFDTGDKLEYIKTVVNFALARDDMAEPLKRFLQDKLQ